MSHIYYELYYHIIWGTKYRFDLITDEISMMIEDALSRKIIQLGGQQLEYNSVEDHCHLLAKIPPPISISDFIGQIKGYSSHEVNQQKGDKYLNWQQGFGVVSLSQKGIPFVRKYIQKQKQHHKDGNIIPMLEYIYTD